VAIPHQGVGVDLPRGFFGDLLVFGPGGKVSHNQPLANLWFHPLVSDGSDLFKPLQISVFCQSGKNILCDGRKIMYPYGR
jgi:hypothetical protein